MMKAAGSVTPENVTADTTAMLDAIASDPAASRGPKVCVGYCLGARVSLHVASVLSDEFVAAAGIHPGALINDKPDSPHYDLAGVRGELYFAFAEIDRSATPELVARVRDGRLAGLRPRGQRGPLRAHARSVAAQPVAGARRRMRLGIGSYLTMLSIRAI
jgi:dienelactone hydrolase